LGIRYAQAPVDELRFRKPVAAPVWTGTIDATEVGQNCPQSNPIKPEEGVSGQEDCLFLDITLPSGTKVGDKKSVMMSSVEVIWACGIRERPLSGYRRILLPLEETQTV